MRRRVWLALLLAALPAGLFVARPSAAENALYHGCWFEPPDPPACDICRANCNPGQRCCLKIPLDVE